MRKFDTKKFLYSLKKKFSGEISLFPHFTRSISAPIPKWVYTCSLAIIFAGILSINLFHDYFFEKNNEKNYRFAIMAHPYSSKLHEQLGQYYLPTNKTAGEKEYFLAEELFKNSTKQSLKVLGTQTSPLENWKKIVSKEKKIRGEIKFWQTVYLSLPQYYYTHLKLATLYYQLGEKDKSIEHLKKVLLEDPLNETALALYNKIRAN